MDFKDPSEEQRAKVAGASSSEDILKLVQEEGYELSDEKLEQIFGGFFGLVNDSCPKCGKGEMIVMYYNLTCNKCGYIRYQC